MKIGDKKVIDGTTFQLMRQNIGTKVEATRAANWQRRGGFRARLEKVARGNYRMWTA